MIYKLIGQMGREVTSDTSDLQFESSHQQILLLSTVLKNCIKNKEKEAGKAPFLKC